MSASQDKKRRSAAQATGLGAREIAEQKKRAKTKRNYIIIGSIVVVLAIVIIVLNSNLFYSGTNAVEIGNQKYSAAEVNYYYYSNYYNFMNNGYGSYFIDSNTSLKDQEYYTDEYASWHDYFIDQAISSLTEISALYEKALASGFTITQEASDEIEEELVNLEDYSASAGYPGVKQYIGVVYGKGMSVKLLREIMTQNAIATDYAQSIYDAYEYSSEELETYYQEHKDELDFISYSYYYIDGSVAEHEHEEGEEHDEEAEAADAMSKAKALADAIAAEIEDEASFDAAAARIDEGTITTSKTIGYGINETLSWLLESGRKSGDVTVIDADTGYYVLLFTGRDDNHYQTVSVRHILIQAEADEEGVYTEEAKAAALLEAEDILSRWQSGVASEESFAVFAEDHSADGGSNTNGGLYENIRKGQMVAEFDAFCFDSHQPGDTGIVYGENANYAGYHVIYFVGEDGLYSDYLADYGIAHEGYTADLGLREVAYSDWHEELLSPYSAKRNFSLKFAGDMR